MIDLEEVDREIAQLESREITYAIAEKLCYLYSLRDHSSAEPVHYSYAEAPTSESEFVTACRAAGFERTLSVLDEHMAAIRAVYPKEYDAVLRKIKSRG